MARRFENGVELRGPLVLSGSTPVIGNVPVYTGPNTPPAWGSPVGIIVTEVTLNFGSNPTLNAVFQILTTAAVGQTVLMSPAGSNGDELEFDTFICSAQVIATDTIQARVSAAPGPVAGTRNFTLTII